MTFLCRYLHLIGFLIPQNTRLKKFWGETFGSISLYSFFCLTVEVVLSFPTSLILFSQFPLCLKLEFISLDYICVVECLRCMPCLKKVLRRFLLFENFKTLKSKIVRHLFQWQIYEDIKVWSSLLSNVLIPPSIKLKEYFMKQQPHSHGPSLLSP